MGASASKEYAPAAAQQQANNAAAQQQPQQQQGAQPTLINHTPITETVPAQPAAAATHPTAHLQHVTSTAQVVPMLDGRTGTQGTSGAAHTASRTTLTSTDDDGAEDEAAAGGHHHRPATDGHKTHPATAVSSPSGPMQSDRSDFVHEDLRNEQLLMDRYRDRRSTELAVFPGGCMPVFRSGLHIDPVVTVYRVPRMQTPAHIQLKRTVATPWRRYDAQLKLYQMAAEVAGLQLPGEPASEGEDVGVKCPKVPSVERQEPDEVLDRELGLVANDAAGGRGGGRPVNM